ncbi:MAG: hypothetical protein IT193_19800 [Propionibacteriaceae bacterium]|nr:hypothetical protein [Propionibacteriaceae bacterium]
MPTDPTLVSPDDVKTIIEASQIIDVRLDEIQAGPLSGDLSDAIVRFRRDLSEYGFSDDRAAMLVKIPHTAEWVQESPDGAVEVLARVRLVHVAHFALTAELPDRPSAISAWIDTNVYFMAYPYVRAAFHTVASILDYPSFTLGYLKREDSLPAVREGGDSAAD